MRQRKARIRVLERIVIPESGLIEIQNGQRYWHDEERPIRRWRDDQGDKVANPSNCKGDVQGDVHGWGRSCYGSLLGSLRLGRRITLLSAQDLNR